MTTGQLRTGDYSEEARRRLGEAVKDARIGAGFKHRPAFAKFADISLRSLADLEGGKPGVGEANLFAVARVLPNWTTATPRSILEGGPAPEVAVVDLRQQADANVDLRDEAERQLWAIADLSEEERWAFIDLHRARQARQNRRFGD